MDPKLGSAARFFQQFQGGTFELFLLKNVLCGWTPQLNSVISGITDALLPCEPKCEFGRQPVSNLRTPHSSGVAATTHLSHSKCEARKPLAQLVKSLRILIDTHVFSPLYRLKWMCFTSCTPHKAALSAACSQMTLELRWLNNGKWSRDSVGWLCYVSLCGRRARRDATTRAQVSSRDHGIPCKKR